MLVVRNRSRLDELAAELHDRHGVTSEVLVADVAEAAAREKVADRPAAGVQVLVNNAGSGTLINVASVAGLLSGRASTYSPRTSRRSDPA